MGAWGEIATEGFFYTQPISLKGRQAGAAWPTVDTHDYTDFSVAGTKLLEFDVWNVSGAFSTYENTAPICPKHWGKTVCGDRR